MLFNYFNIYPLKCLKMPRAHATPAFSDLKVSVYGMKGQCLWGVLFSLVLNPVGTGWRRGLKNRYLTLKCVFMG